MDGVNRVFIIVTIVVGMILFPVLYEISALFTFQSVKAASPPATKTTDIEAEALDNPAENSHNLRSCQVSSQYPEKILRWCDIITHYAEKRNLDPDLLAALILQESGGNPHAYSHSGAVGLMQVMPRDGIAASFMCKNGPCFSNRPTIDELQDPEFNISYGSKMLSGLVKSKGGLREALKSYGPMDVGYSYSDKVLAIYKRYQD